MLLLLPCCAPILALQPPKALYSFGTHVLCIELVGGVRLCDCCPRCAHSSSLCCPSRDFCAIFTVGVSCHSAAHASASPSIDRGTVSTEPARAAIDGPNHAGDVDQPR